ncbi:Hypothetical protein R9X50_00179900 [Acrodontium crateriforme]|uniref:BHLH domain-containing protein n=1 Tax=Acrodontium crateriforme TaxID=150365 RepID=A0AAQ3M0C0_9PEZI|nr:Hypothetical protein R9X50_00179900 [Acrodontium crateriforme]
MDSTAAWSAGFASQPIPYSQQFDGANENWEDWLRWDPTAEPTSPEDGTMGSASSHKTTSPMQDNVFPIDTGFFGKGGADDTLAPPLIVGEDMLDFNNLQDTDPFMFGAPNDVSATFDFDTNAPIQNAQPSAPRINTNTTSWALPANNLHPHAALSVVSNDQSSTSPLSAVTPDFKHSPDSSTQKRSSLSSSQGSPDPQPKKRGGRKRKAEVVDKQSPEEKEESGDSQDGDEPPVKKTSHNVIEKRYRNNLNDKIVELRNSVPSLRAMGRSSGKGPTEDLEGLTPAHKLNKATVMGKATEYIKHLEKRNKTMATEMDALKARLAAVEAAISLPRDRQQSMSNSPTSDVMRSRQPSSASQTGLPNFLNVPSDNMRHGMPIVNQQYMQPQQGQPQYARPPNPPVDAQNQPQTGNGRGRGVLNKVMMGAMAGVMMMEGFAEQHSEDPHQLSAAPFAFFRRGLDITSPSSAAALSKHANVSLLKMALILGALLYLLMPLLTFSTRRKQAAKITVRLPNTPSLASPVEVRRKAWLTAVQTVYVPKHFLLEVAAVTTKMIMLSLRRMIGSEAYNMLTGTNKEEEAARVKAWNIAIDAQLAGGDAEVSYYRLLLTLMASGTLPDSPVRLMQKAVHFRVFFWDVANAGYGNILGFKAFTEKVGKIYWDSARKLQKELVQAKSLGLPIEDDEIELLPDHLASLVELDCDEVLGDEMIQRAWNLAWNKPSAHGTTANSARDSVVEDHGIRSPLDAVAAWYANMIVDDALVDTLGNHPSTWDADYYVALAVSIAPPASSTQVRALATKAVLSNMNREANIVAALEALPVSSSGTGAMNFVSHAPASPDVRTALTLAKLVSLLTPNASDSTHRRAQDMLANLHLAPASFTLLSAVAAYRLLRTFRANRQKPACASRGLENMAASLRVWTGTSAGRTAGLDGESCGKVVDLCLSVARKVGGWDEADSGYGSTTEGSSKAGALETVM